MNTALRFGLVLVLTAICFIPVAMRAGDKKAKEPDKKKPAKDIVVEDSLENADLKDRLHTQSFSKTYTVKMENGKSYQLELGSTAFSVVLRLENLDGTPIPAHITQFGGQRVMILYDPMKTQDYQLVVTSQNANATGKFKLVIKDASAYTALNVADKLDANDKQYAGARNKRHKLFFANLEKGKTYQIDMRSAAFDSYLFFESPDGKLLAQDDDSGGFPNARIIYTATETGKFRVIATYFSGGIGEFTLTVRQTDGEAPPIEKRFLDKKDK